MVSATKHRKGERQDGIKVTGAGSYVRVPLDKIQIVERPEPGQETNQIFFNPRSLDSFSGEAMMNLMNSIKAEGLQQPPIVRAFTDGKRSDPIFKLELVAGERRVRSILKLVENNELCYDDQTDQKIPASELFQEISVKLLYNINDEKALRIAFLENNEHQSLSIKEEIDLVERLIKAGYGQEEISDMLGSNVTWVSQTNSFRTQLPEGAFEKLLTGKMTRHVAVRILAYKPEDREEAFNRSVIKEAEQREQKTNEINQSILEAEDEEEILAMREDQAVERGDNEAAKRQQKKRKAAVKKLEQAKEKKKRIESEAGIIRQGHLADGAQEVGISPKKAKVLSRQQIEQFYIKLPSIWLQNGDKVDPICEEKYPAQVLRTVVATAQAILSGQHDTGRTIREILIEEGVWERRKEEPEVELLDILDDDEQITDE